MDLLVASLAGFGAVVGFVVGAIIGPVVWSLIFGIHASDIPPIVIGGLGCAVGFAWLGIRIASRLTSHTQAH